jgi:hypothetical protein
MKELAMGLTVLLAITAGILWTFQGVIELAVFFWGPGVEVPMAVFLLVVVIPVGVARWGRDLVSQ